VGDHTRIESEMGDMQYLTVTPEDRIVIGDTGGAVFTLKNPTTANAVYKIKFTAPDRATIRPCAGFVGPMDEVEVVVTDTTTHPQSPSSPPDDETKLRSTEKLLISAAKWIPRSATEASLSPKEAWKVVDKADVFDTKLTVKFRSSSGGKSRKAEKSSEESRQNNVKQVTEQTDDLKGQVIRVTKAVKDIGEKSLEKKLMAAPSGNDRRLEMRTAFEESTFCKRRSVSPEPTRDDNDSLAAISSSESDTDQQQGEDDHGHDRKMAQSMYYTPTAAKTPNKPSLLSSVINSTPTREDTPFKKMTPTSTSNKMLSSEEHTRERKMGRSSFNGDTTPALYNNKIEMARSSSLERRRERSALDEANERAVRRELNNLKSEVLETDSTLIVLKRDQEQLRNDVAGEVKALQTKIGMELGSVSNWLQQFNTTSSKLAEAMAYNGDSGFKSLDDRMVALFHKIDSLEQGQKKLRHKLDDVGKENVSSTVDQGSRTKETCDRISTYLQNMDDRMNQMAGKLDLRDETLKQVCATKDQVKEIEGQLEELNGRLEKIGSSIAKRTEFELDLKRMNAGQTTPASPTKQASTADQSQMTGIKGLSLESLTVGVTFGATVFGVACLVGIFLNRK